MATIIDKPDALSLSGNMRKFVLGASGPVSLTLKKGEAVLIERSYEPGADGMITINARDIVENQLSYTLDTANAVYSQHSILGDFTAIIDGESLAFRAIRSGVANLADTPANWLGSHFLTWQPKVKDVTYYSPEWLTYYAVSACSVKVKATFQDKSTNTTLLKNMDAGECVTLNLQYAVISSLFGNRYPLYFEVWAEAGDLKLTEAQYYKYSDTLSEDEQWFLFENSLGGLDTFRAYGMNKLQAGHEHLVAELGDSLLEYDVDTERAYTKNTGHLDGYARRWLLDFFPSRGKYVHEASAIRKIVVTESDASYTSNDLPSSFTFTYRIADRSKLLNLTRNEREIPSALVIPDTGTPDFIFPPRLAELPRIDLGEGVLFPAFDPHNPKPTVSSFGQIHDTIKNSVINELEDAWRALSNLGGGGGGEDDEFYHVKLHDLTEPTDENGFTALRTLKEIKDSLVEADGMFLRKDIDDRAEGNISFAKEIYSAEFLDGMDGKGWRIEQNGAALFDSVSVRSDIFAGNKIGSPSFTPGFAGWGTEIDIPTATGTFDNVFIRKTFTAYEIVYSQIYGVGGNQVVSDLNKIGAVERLPDRWRCYMDDMDGLMLMNLRAGDGIRIQTRKGLTSIRYMFGRCVAVSNDYFDIAYPMLEGSGEPETGDFAMRWGNDRDTTRQGLIYLTSSDQGAPYIAVYDGITGVSTQDKLKAQLGNLSMIRTRRGTQLKGYGAYLDGAFIENSSIVLDSGMTVEQQFFVMNGELNSKIEGVRNDMSVEGGNLLRNSSFALNMDYWVTNDIVRFVDVAEGAMLWVDGSFYTEKNKVADIYRDGDKNVLRILNTGIIQANKRISGDKKAGVYSIAFYYKVIRSGILTAGFPMKPLYLSELKQSSDQYLKQVLVEEWDGMGDFMIGFTGEILIYGVSLFNDALANARIELQTQITQNAEAIKLTATKQYVDTETGAIYSKYNSELSVIAGEIAARVTETHFNAETGQIREEISSGLSVQAGQISAVSTRVDNVNKTIETAGWINSAQGNLLYASKNGDDIISYINQTATTTTISSNRISLIGAVTFNMFDPVLAGQINGKANTSQLRKYAFSDGDQISMSDLQHDLQIEINAKLTGSSTTSGNKLANVIINGQTLIAGGYIQADLINADEIWCTSLAAVRGRIGGFSIDGKVLANEDGWAGISIKYPNDRFVQINPEEGYALMGLKQRGGVALNVESYMSTGISIKTYASQLATSIHSTGKCYFGLMGGETFHLNLHNMRDGGYAEMILEGIRDGYGDMPVVNGNLRFHYDGDRYFLIIKP